MSAPSGLPDPLRQSIDRWLHLWEVPHLESKSRIEWSPRLTRSLGRCYPDKHLIRIAAYLESAPDGVLQEVLCHEMAHLATRELHGRKARPHGPEWKALMQKAGFAPRLRRRRRSPYVFVHRCPVCQLFRTARRLMSRWRCAACVTSGLEGRLTITRHAIRAIRAIGREAHHPRLATATEAFRDSHSKPRPLTMCVL